MHGRWREKKGRGSRRHGRIGVQCGSAVQCGQGMETEQGLMWRQRGDNEVVACAMCNDAGSPTCRRAACRRAVKVLLHSRCSFSPHSSEPQCPARLLCALPLPRCGTPARELVDAAPCSLLPLSGPAALPSHIAVACRRAGRACAPPLAPWRGPRPWLSAAAPAPFACATRPLLLLACSSWDLSPVTVQTHQPCDRQRSWCVLRASSRPPLPWMC